MIETIEKNDSWKKLSLKDKLLVCHPLVTYTDANNIEDITCE
jgi:hypothetical protein